MNWLDYEYRVNKLDEFMNKISTDTNTKFIILSLIHYSILFVLIYYNLFFSNNIYIFSVCYFILIISIIVNLFDNGCFIMKLERKYTGKWWYGLYTAINYLKEDIINANSCSLLFKIICALSFLYGLYRLYNYYYGTDFITQETKQEPKLEPKLEPKQETKPKLN